MKSLVIFCLFLLVASVTAQQSIIQNGDGNYAVEIGGGQTTIDHATITNQITNGDPITVNVILPEGSPQSSYLGIGDVNYTRLIYPNRIALVPVMHGCVIAIRSGTPVSLYTINTIDKDKVQGSQSIPVYDDIYDRMDHGETPWVDWIPYYTTKETIVSTTDGYLVVDNRNIFSGYNLVEIEISSY